MPTFFSTDGTALLCKFSAKTGSHEEQYFINQHLSQQSIYLHSPQKLVKRKQQHQFQQPSQHLADNHS